MRVQDVDAPIRGVRIRPCMTDRRQQYRLMRYAAFKPRPSMTEIAELLHHLESIVQLHHLGIVGRDELTAARVDVFRAIEAYRGRPVGG